MSYPTKTALSIKLTEPLVFLKHFSTDTPASRRRGNLEQNETPALLRGLLVLDLHKPIKVSSIEVELEGRCRNVFSEGVGARRIEVLEEHKILSITSVLFDASKESHPVRRRHASVGPSVRLGNSHNPDDDHRASSDEDAESDSDGIPPYIPTETFFPSADPRAQRQQRRFSVEPLVANHTETSHIPTTVLEGMSAIPSLPYTPHESPVSSPMMTSIDIGITSSLTERGIHHRSQQQETTEPSLPLNMRHLSEPLINFSSPEIQEASSSSQPLEQPPNSRLSSEASLTTSPILSQTPRQLSLSPQNSHTETSAPQSPVETHLSNTQPIKPRNRARFSLPHIPSIQIPSVLKEMRNLNGTANDRSDSPSAPSSSMGEGRRAPSPDRGPPPKNKETERGREGRGRAKGKKSAFEKISEALRSSVNASTSHSSSGSAVGDGSWKEMRKGTYTYPISFLLPASLRLPPSMMLPNGSVTYRLKASVHRPGVLVKKIRSSREVRLISCPVEVEGEHEDNVVVEREWEEQLRYRIELTKRKVEVGGEVGVRIMLVPMEKIKIWRLGVFLEERIEYLTQFKRIAAREPPRFFELWDVKGKKVPIPPGSQDGIPWHEREGGKDKMLELPLLPISSDDPEAMSDSPLLPFVVPSQGLDTDDAMTTEEAEALGASELLGTGPYTIANTVHFPHCDRLNFGYLQQDATGIGTITGGGGGKSNIEVKHAIKVVLRVERGDDKYMDKFGKRKRWDIVVQIGVGVISCHCGTSWTALPRYSRLDPGVIPNCRDGRVGLANTLCSCKSTGHNCTSGPQTSFFLPGARARRASADVPTSTRGEEETAIQYERLVAGGEEVPPAYDSTRNPTT